MTRLFTKTTPLLGRFDEPGVSGPASVTIFPINMEVSV